MSVPITKTLPGLLRKRLRALCGANWRSESYLVAVSGGLDSICLLDLLLQCVPPAQLKVAHFDHRMRKGASRADALWVEEFCREQGIACFLGRRQGVKKSEAALRKERYAFLQTVRARTHCAYLFTAHHADDQLETMLMRLVRGTGLTGLGAMSAKTGKLVRPLLGVPKAELIAYASARNLRYRTDVTNAGTDYFRNRIRHRLLPPLYALAEEHGGKALFLKRTSLLLTELRGVAAEQRRETELLFQSLCTDTDFWLRLEPESFADLAPPHQRQLVRRVLAHLQITETSRSEVERIRRFLRSSRQRTQTLTGQIIERSCGQVYFLKKSPPDSHPWQRQKGKWLCPTLGITLQTGPGVTPRFFRPGDRQGRKKLKKLFLEMKIPAPERSLLPLLVDQRSQEVVWFYPQTHERVRVIESRFPFSHRLSIGN